MEHVDKIAAFISVWCLEREGLFGTSNGNVECTVKDLVKFRGRDSACNEIRLGCFANPKSERNIVIDVGQLVDVSDGHGGLTQVNPVGYQTVLYVTIVLYIIALACSFFLVGGKKKAKN